MDGWVWGWEFGPVYFLHRMDIVVPCTRPKTLYQMDDFDDEVEKIDFTGYFQNLIKWMTLMSWRKLMILFSETLNTLHAIDHNG
jgi:hypothetical protein